MFKVGDKVKFNEETKKKFREWLNDKNYCGREIFCKELKNFDLNGYFTIIRAGESLSLKEMPDWYFDTSEFEPIMTTKITIYNSEDEEQIIFTEETEIALRVLNRMTGKAGWWARAEEENGSFDILHFVNGEWVNQGARK